LRSADFHYVTQAFFTPFQLAIIISPEAQTPLPLSRIPARSYVIAEGWQPRAKTKRGDRHGRLSVLLQTVYCSFI
jgi:hypothetical protein